MFTANEILEKEKLFSEEYQKISIGYRDIDKNCDFLRRGQVSMLIARPGMGKTAFALNITRNLLRAGKKVLYLSFDQKPASLIQRLLDITMVEKDQLDRLFVDDTYYYDYHLREFINKVNDECSDIDLIVFDSIPCNDIGTIQWLYKAFPNAATLLITTAPRDCENRENHRVNLADIKEFSLFNPYVFSIATIYREDYYNDYSEERDNIMQFSLLKGEKQNLSVQLQVSKNFFLTSFRFDNKEV